MKGERENVKLFKEGFGMPSLTIWYLFRNGIQKVHSSFYK